MAKTKLTTGTYGLILKLAQKGMSNTEIADVTGLTRQTIQNYLADPTSKLGETVREIRDANKLLGVAEKGRLNKSALSAARKLLKNHRLTEIRTRTDADGNLVSTETVTREREPNAGIVQFVLENTDPQNWREAQNQQADETESDNELKIVIDD